MEAASLAGGSPPGGTGRVCVSLAESTTARLRERCREAARDDVVELRLDALDGGIDAAAQNVAALLQECPQPAIVTCRAADEDATSACRREALLESALRAGAWAVDVELEAPFAGRMTASHRARIVLSHHWSSSLPSDLESVCARAAALRPAIVKLVAPAGDAEDCAPLLEAGRRLRAAGQPAACFCLGENGRASRLLDFAAGGALLYAAGAGGDATAPGQWPATLIHADLQPRHWQAGTSRYGLLGDPIDHSLSPVLFNLAFALDGSGRAYVPVPGKRFEAMLRLAADSGLRGLSVTMPFKREALRHCLADDLATRMGAANTLVRSGGCWTGHNTDGPAVIEVLRRHLPLSAARVLVLGAGGAARAAATALVEAGADVVVTNRTASRADDLARALGCESAPWSAAGDTPADVVVNATSVGMSTVATGATATRSTGTTTVPGTVTSATAAATAGEDFPTFRLRGDEVVMEMVYRPAQTPLLRQARARGCVAIEGLEMFLAQAAGQFRLWTGEEPPLPDWREAARGRLAADRED